ncbi:hypothetical protein J2T20_003316 [Paenibacillus wynnii]|nr:hypothetical protein [Paenibacillus wynnii]
MWANVLDLSFLNNEILEMSDRNPISQIPNASNELQQHSF